MKDTNSVVLVGRLTTDADLKILDSNRNVFNFRIAVNSATKKGDVWEDKANFFNISYFCSSNKIGEYLLKGSQVAISGELEFQEWETDAGDKRNAVKVNAKSVQLIGGKRNEDGAVGSYVNKKNTYQKAEKSDEFESDIPF